MISICILNFNKPVESELCLRSIKKLCLFNHKVIFFNNGSNDSDRIIKLYYEGLIDRLILNKTNEGGGITKEVIDNVSSDYVFWIQNDCEIAGLISQEAMDSWIEFLEKNTDNIKCIDLTGGICGTNTYSGRSFFINTSFYNSINKFELGLNGEKLYGGPGPYNHIKYLEQFIQEEFKAKKYNVAHVLAIKDNGYSSVRENPDGSQYIHQPDRKGLKVLKYPIEKYIYPKWSDKEWDSILSGQKWNDWDIPELEQKDSFIVPQWHE